MRDFVTQLNHYPAHVQSGSRRWSSGTSRCPATPQASWTARLRLCNASMILSEKKGTTYMERAEIIAQILAILEDVAEISPRM